jgi:transcriptional regulator with XRE-family HTH domain
MQTETEQSTTGRRIAYYRSERGLTQQQLANRTGLTKRMIEKYEADNVLPSLVSFALIVLVLKVPADYLLPRVTMPETGGTDV